MESQGHDRGVGVGVVGVLVLQEQVFDQLHAVGPLERQVRGQQGI